jgi:hypothetical protein
MNTDVSNHSNSNLNSSEEVYLSLVQSYINATREILNGYMTFETGITRSINSQIFRNFTRNSFSQPLSRGERTTVTPQPPESVQTEPESEPILETPVNLIRRETQLPNTPIRPTLHFRSTLPSSSTSMSPFQIPTPVRLTNRLETPQERESREPYTRRFGLPEPESQSQPESQPQPQTQPESQPESQPQTQPESQQESTIVSSSLPTPPFSSTFVRYRLPVAIGPPRRAASTNTSASVSTLTREVPVPAMSPENSPPPPPSSWRTQTWQQLRQQRQQQQQQLNSLSPILPVEPTPLPPAPALAPLTTASRLMLNLLDTPRLNDTLVYYTQIIDREFTRSQENTPLSYDAIQQQTRIIPYCTISEPLNDICPISQVPFELIDSVMQINNCKHNFNPYSLLRWFDSHSTCPMCRRQINVNVNYDYRNDDREDDEQTIHMYNNGREEEPYRSSTDSNRHDRHRYDDDDSDVSSVG